MRIASGASEGFFSANTLHCIEVRTAYSSRAVRGAITHPSVGSGARSLKQRRCLVAGDSDVCRRQPDVEPAKPRPGSQPFSGGDHGFSPTTTPVIVIAHGRPIDAPGLLA